MAYHLKVSSIIPLSNIAEKNVENCDYALKQSICVIDFVISVLSLCFDIVKNSIMCKSSSIYH